VHSAKDVPGELPDGLTIAGVPARADPRDCLCGAASVAELASGARVGTGSLRRRAQLLSARPDLEVTDLRGNVDTRLARLAAGDFDALVLAAAGLERLGRDDGRPVPASELLPAPGQGCLALEARADDDDARELAWSVTDRTTLEALTAERSLVSVLGASCRTPVAALAERVDDELRLSAYAGTPDGATWIRDELSGDPAEAAALGTEVGERMLAAGAAEVLAAAELFA
jgi:hydroxymethylbilane synthase